MKPIELQLAGLHSYREMQTVDFNSLCEQGIFGIFGPTGSGKSTVLDAITLALFGTVKRASGYQGVINQQESEARVSFTFEVGRGESRSRYRVERVLRRSGDYGAQTRNCRLIRIGPGDEVVMVDKDSQVKSKIQEILGLNAEDFTRAVVLPQGRFHEFLTLKPADRRRMLERLFELDRFGEQLKKRLAEMRGVTRSQLEQIIAEQKGLGDCSPAALKNAREEMETSCLFRKQQESIYRNARSEADKAREVWKLQEERDKFQRDLDMLQAGQADICRAEERLETAARAEFLRGMIEDVERGETDLEERRRRLQELQNKVQELELKTRAADAQARKRRQDRDDKEPALVKLSIQLEQALEEEALLDEWIEQERKYREQLDGYKKKMQRLCEQRHAMELEQEQTEKRLEELRTCQQEMLVTPEEEKRARRAGEIYREIMRLEDAGRDLQAQLKQAVKLRDRLQSREKELGPVTRKLETSIQAENKHLQYLQDHPPLSEGELESRAARLEQWKYTVERIQDLAGKYRELENEYRDWNKKYEELTRQKKECSLAVEILKKHAEKAALAVKKAREKLDKAREFNMAAYLAGKLESGSPCPVCGSVEHPAPVLAAGEELKPLQRTLEKAEQAEKEWQQKLAAEEGKVRRLDGELRALKPQGEKLLKEQETIRAGSGRLWTNLPDSWKEKQAGELPGLLQGEEQLYQARKEAVGTWKQQLEKTRTRQKKMQDKLDRLRPELARLESELEYCRRNAGELARNLKEINRERIKKEEELQPLLESAGLKGPGDVPAFCNNVEKKRKKYYRCREEEVKLEPLARETRESLQKVEQQLREVQWQSEVLGNKREELEKNIEKRRKGLASLTGGRRVKPVLKDVTEQLNSLRFAVDRAEKNYQNAVNVLSSARLKLEGEQNTFNTIEAQLNDLHTRLKQAAREYNFATPGEARDALLEPAERKKLKELVDNYRREEQKLKQRLQDAKDRLGERSLSMGEKKQVEENLQEAEKKLGLARQREGAAENHYKQLEERSDRWQALEEKRKGLSRREELLEELERLLRGRTLVEFMARRRLENLVTLASARLGRLTGYRYALELDGQGGFILRDDGNGGSKRPISTLSGGETFLASLTLALALSDQIQRRGKAPLEFFFLDEGFGALDDRHLETVMDTLERLPLEQVSIGLISHLPQLRSRLPRRLIVEPAGPGRGSAVYLERA